ncbi:hypothetical protein COV89_02335 [Candidatus Shapirobacteria bacterium CG11_big_fil_rev_8_21_14_0_20_40_12]|uniref:DNA 3'-5' helicase n=1 Tax=Candidatus Shapirobacteria bacterium CG11_big_fil_rev_8_21_14_0_20_40_12 TaxID=1974889 RepID=A0A2H0KFU2_9BACT|nr:MAG: hypothetical protein COV89_02335 [Candidatus Shapirobacteria bacterium CG11_big_fil_rev_8_21_14_0_20_40_12]
MAEEKVLNRQQIEAIEYGEGPLLIIAGAGTGKTTVITERIKYLITQKNISPSEILALTFTEKAAHEMEIRVDEALPLGYANMWTSTFHSFGDRILHDEVLNIGLDPRFRLMTEAESVQLFRKNLFKFDLDYFRPLGNPTKFIDGMRQHFGRLKDEDVSPEEYLKFSKGLEGREEKEKYLELAKAYKTYEEIKIEEGLMDFSDLITNVLGLFRKRPGILKKYQQKFKYILVDEFQDTNYSQYILVKLLMPTSRSNLTVVCDDNQSIYRFRGAAVSNVLQFIKDYPKAKKVVLNKNYRSTQAILDASYKLIKNNDPDTLEATMGISKKLQKMREVEETPIEFLISSRVENEAETVVLKVKELSEKYAYKDFAILVRANNHAEPFVKELIRKGIPYQFLGPGRLFKQPEVKDLIAYCLVLYNFEDNVAMYRLLSMDYFNMSGRDLAGIVNFSRKNNLSIFEGCEKINEISVASETKEKIEKIIKMIHHHMDLAKSHSAGQILYFFLEDTGLLKNLVDYKTEAGERRAINLSKFFDKLKSYETQHEDASVYAVVDFINLSMELGESPLASETDWTENDAVNILTVHSAKGLEFPVVFLVNLVDRRFPTTERHEQVPIPEELIKEILPKGDFHLEEERRLFYVGMTRAGDFLFLTAASYYGEGKQVRKISPFVAEALGNQTVRDSSFAKASEDRQLAIFDFKPTEEPRISNLPITYLSYSQIETFNTCPQQYKYRHVLRIPTPPSAALSFGDIIHQTMKDFYQRALAGQNPNKRDLLEILTKNWSSLGFPSKALEEKYKKEGQKILGEFFDKSYNSKNLPITLEQVFSVKVGANLKVGGRIDRIDRVKPGLDEIEIIDYKTGKSSTQKDVEKNLQMTIYAMAAADGILTYMGLLQKTPKPEEIKVSFYFFDKQEKISSFRKKEDFDRVKKELVIKAEEISKSDFSPTPGKHCDFCEYKLLCEAWN